MGSTKKEIAAADKLGCCSVLFITIITSALPITFVYHFTGIGYGLETARSTLTLVDDAVLVLQCVGGLFLLGYLLDVHFWNPEHLIAKLFTFALTIVTVGCLLVLTGENPFWPVCLLSVTAPALLLSIKWLFFRKVLLNHYAKRCGFVLLFLGVALMVTFFGWLFTPYGEIWNPDTRAQYSYESGCKPLSSGASTENCLDPVSGVPCFYKEGALGNTTKAQFTPSCLHNCLDVYETCDTAFLVWVNPALAAVSLMVIGILTDYVTATDPMNPKVQVVVKAAAAFLFLFWIFASTVGGGSGLTSSLIAFAIAMTAGSSILVTAVITSEDALELDPDLAQELVEDALEEAVEKSKGFQDIIKGVVILAASPLLILYLVISFVNQIIRKIKACFGTPLAHKGFLTEQVSAQFYDFQHNWNHANVLTYAYYTGVFYVFFAVVFSKFTSVFLSWLIQTTAAMDMIAVTGIVTAVGMGLFMLPPVPGLPIYLTSGIVLVSIGMDELGLIWSIVYALIVSLFIKLLACTVQQKIIGGLLGGSTAVKQAVGINSEAIRTMRLILEEPGFSFNKTAILVGGPDWPVSVLCGILGLPLIPILIGTLPVFAIIAPTVLTGSFSFMSSQETDQGQLRYPMADTWGTVVTSFSAGIVFYNTFAAAGAITSTVSKRKAEIDALDYDEDVLKADEEAKKVAVVRKRVVVWSNVPAFFKMCLILSVLCMIASVYMMAIFSKDCFQDYDLMYTIEEHLGGNWLNIVKPFGWKALALFGVSFVLYALYNGWTKRATRKAFEESETNETAALVKSGGDKGTYS